MNLIRNLALALILSTVLLVSGCALLDGMMLEPLNAPDGSALYIDLEASKDGDLVLVEEEDMEPGKAYERAYSDKPSESVNWLSALLGLIPGWGTLASAIPGFLVAGYAALRGRKKLAASKELSDAWKGLAKHGVKVIEALKNHQWDADFDGKISADEVTKGIVAVVRSMGKDVVEPEFLAEVVRAMTGSFTEAEKQKILEDAAAEIGK